MILIIGVKRVYMFKSSMNASFIFLFLRIQTIGVVAIAMSRARAGPVRLNTLNTFVKLWSMSRSAEGKVRVRKVRVSPESWEVTTILPQTLSWLKGV